MAERGLEAGLGLLDGIARSYAPGLRAFIDAVNFPPRLYFMIKKSCHSFTYR